MVRLIFRLLAEAAAGSVVTWILSHLGDIGTFVGLLGSGGLLGGTIFADGAQAGLVRFGASVVVFVAPFVCANAYERHEGKPIAAVVAEESRTGTTWGETGGPVVDTVIGINNRSKDKICPDGSTSPHCGGATSPAPSGTSTRGPSPKPSRTSGGDPSVPPSPSVTRSPSATAPPSSTGGPTPSSGPSGDTAGSTTNGTTGGTEPGGRFSSPTPRRSSPPPVPGPGPNPGPNGDRNTLAGPAGGSGGVPDRARSGAPTP
ncbi:hypothetical protein [Streptomyces albireticuli]|uniref:hypothetical protein n=1 Tax=Streptomyces albireticuli TaxID=1940 RepID=UPI0036AF0732